MLTRGSQINTGDCLVVLKQLADNSVDAVVTDPPYGISFMNKHWDYDVPKVEVWQEVLRVLKPGGHILCACGTRTQHRMTVNIEDAGFEIRDVIAWIYGSGFPKSLNIGKEIDKLQGNEREVIGEKKRGDVQKAKESGSGYLADPANRNNIKQFGYGTETLTKGNSEYEGYGTALKPAMELWTLARKPISEKTVAQNVLKYGTGGINIDGCRIGYQSESDKASAIPQGKITSKDGHTGVGAVVGGINNIELNKEQWIKEKQIGRFPANIIHDGSEEVLENFPDTKSGLMKQHIEGGEFNCYGKQYPRDVETIGDSGSAARFFYCAKASKSERNKGLEDFIEKKIDNSRKEGNVGGDNPRNRGVNPQTNNHPTVKPISLMQYLCRFVTPKNGTVLDPFMGSGTTGIAAKLENFNFIGIEREEEYCKIAQARISAWKRETPQPTNLTLNFNQD